MAIVCQLPAAPADALDWQIDDVNVCFDTTLSQGVTVQIAERDSDIIGIANGGTAYSVNHDEGNMKWRVLPGGKNLLAQAVSPVPTATGLLNSDCSVMPVTLFTIDHKARTIARIVEAAKAFSPPSSEPRATDWYRRRKTPSARYSHRRLPSLEPD